MHIATKKSRVLNKTVSLDFIYCDFFTVKQAQDLLNQITKYLIQQTYDLLNQSTVSNFNCNCITFL